LTQSSALLQKWISGFQENGQFFKLAKIAEKLVTKTLTPGQLDD
jgi:hypothetical protein